VRSRWGLAERSSLCFVVCALCLCVHAGAAEGASPAPRPNTIVILADDLGFSDLGCYGSEIRTPHLDRMAREGIRFTNFYNTARCCPTRASLLTGLYPHQAGVGHMDADRGLSSYQGFLNDRCVTIAEALGRRGYRTYMSGKWHIGFERGHWPLDRGFDRYFGLISGACNYFRLGPGRQMALDNESYTPPAEGFYMTDAFTDHAVSYIRENGRGAAPFFLYVAYTAPHFPLHALPEDIARYRGRYLIGWDELRQRRYKRLIELGLIDSDWRLSPRNEEVPAWEDVADKEAWDLKMAVYAAQIDRMDQGIGEILRALDDMGIEDNTLVMFLSDNGGAAAAIDAGKPGAPAGDPDSYMSYHRPWANASDTPFRLFKQWVHEGGISTPCIVRWPAVIKDGGRITHEVAHVIDIMATCLDVAGVEYPSSYHGTRTTPLEGVSVAPVLRGVPWKGHDYLFWEHVGHRAVRHGKWKLVAERGREWELYDLQADRSELENLAAEKPDRVKELAGQYRRWAERCGVVPPEDLPREHHGLPWYALPPDKRPKAW
jgi:arylsulfatase A-like enzyme